MIAGGHACPLQISFLLCSQPSSDTLVWLLLINKMIMRNRLNFTRHSWIWAAILFLTGSFAMAQATQSLNLVWDASPDSTVSGYRVYYGTSSGNYTTVIDVGNTTTATISNLTPGTTYYFVVTAYNASGVESTPSNETAATATGSPTVAIATPGNSLNFNGPSTVTLSATASEVGGSIVKVEFYEGSNKVGESSTSPFKADWTAQPGSHNVCAVAYDSTGTQTQSATLSVTVTQPAITSMQCQSDGSCQLTLKGAPGRNNSVYASSDMQNWQLVATVMNTSGLTQVADAQAAGQTRRFYRMVAE